MPNNLIKREELTKIIVTAFEIEGSDGDINFADINKNEWYYPFVKKAYNAGIVKGMSDETFGTSSYVTRQDIAVMLSRVLEKYGKNLEYTKDYTAFADENEISAYALDGVKTLYKLGVISGYEDGTFRPDQPITRAEAMTIINRMLGRGVSKGYVCKGAVRYTDNDPGSWYYFEVLEATNDHEYRNARPFEQWIRATILRSYDMDKYERP